MVVVVVVVVVVILVKKRGEPTFLPTAPRPAADFKGN